MPTLNWTSQSNSEASLVYASTDQHPAITIPLYVQDYNLPVRGQKFQDVSTVDSVMSGYQAGARAGFFGNQEPLQTSLSGFIITPTSNTGFTPTTDGTKTGTSLGLTSVCYPEIILAYMEGRMQRTAQGAFQRRDPAQFIDPYGNVFTSPYVISFEAQFTVTPKRQTFTMELWLGA